MKWNYCIIVLIVYKHIYLLSHIALLISVSFYISTGSLNSTPSASSAAKGSPEFSAYHDRYDTSPNFLGAIMNITKKIRPKRRSSPPTMMKPIPRESFLTTSPICSRNYKNDFVPLYRPHCKYPWWQLYKFLPLERSSNIRPLQFAESW